MVNLGGAGFYYQFSNSLSGDPGSVKATAE